MSEEKQNDKTEFHKQLVADIKTWRPRTFFALHQLDDEFKEMIQKAGIELVVVNNIIDILLAIKIKEIPPGIVPRHILSDAESFDGYEIVDDGQFAKYGLKLHRRKDIIKVCCIPLQAKGAVLWYRVQLPHRKVWEQYPDIDCRITFPANYNDMVWADIVMFQRWMPEYLGLMNYCKQIGKKVIYETDDLDIHIVPTNPLYWQYQVGNQINQMKALISMADVVTVTTNNLREELLNFNGDICVFRNKIDTAHKVWQEPKVENPKPVIGWVGGSSHKDDLLIVHKFIQQVCRANDVLFEICGYTKGGQRYVYKEDKKTGRVFVKQEELERGVWDEIVDEFRKEIGDQLLIKESLPLEEYPKFFAAIDIAIAPLQDNRFNRGKSELKIIEAGGYGVPVVASDIEPYREVITHGENGFLAKTTKDWVKYVNRLIRDKELRLKMGDALKKKIQKKYDVSDQKKRVKLYRRLMNKGG